MIRLVLALLLLLASSAHAEVVKCYTENLPSVAQTGTIELNNGFFFTDLDGHEMSATVPYQPIKIVYARYGRSTPVPPGTGGQQVLSIDPGRVMRRTGEAGTYQAYMDATPTLPLLSLWARETDIWEKSVWLTFPYLFDRRADSFYVAYNGFDGGQIDKRYWQFCWIDEGLAPPAGWVPSFETGYLSENVAWDWTNATGKFVAARSQIAQAGGTQVRVTFRAGSAPLVLTKVFMGPATASTADSRYAVSSQTQLDCGGGPGITIPANGQAACTAAFVLDAGNDVVISWHAAAGKAMAGSQWTEWRGHRTYWWPGDAAPALDPAGGSLLQYNAHGVERIETFH